MHEQSERTARFSLFEDKSIQLNGFSVAVIDFYVIFSSLFYFFLNMIFLFLYFFFSLISFLSYNNFHYFYFFCFLFCLFCSLFFSSFLLLFNKIICFTTSFMFFILFFLCLWLAFYDPFLFLFYMGFISLLPIFSSYFHTLDIFCSFV